MSRFFCVYIEKNGAAAIEADLASTRKALGISVKDWRKIQTSLRQIDLKADSEKHSLISHEIGAVTVTLTTYLHIR